MAGWGRGGRTVPPSQLSVRKREIKPLPKHPPTSSHHHDGEWAQRNSSPPLIWGPMLMKLVINSSLCCRFLYCMCNQMWPSSGFTAIKELRACARGGGRSAAGLGSGLAPDGHSAAAAGLAGVPSASGPGVPPSPQAAGGLPSSSRALRNRSTPKRPVGCRVPRSPDCLGARARGGG